MGREILFQAKAKDTGVRFEGDLIRDIDNFGEERTLIFQVLGRGHWREIIVDPETICQFTGLYDNTKWEQLSEAEKKKFLSEWNYKENRKNTKEDWCGRRIFEGDIVRGFDDCNEYGKNLYYFLEIVWNKELSAFEGVDIHSKETFLLPDLADIEVISNVFDNPELLEGAGFYEI